MKKQGEDYIRGYCEETGRPYPKDGYEFISVVSEMASTINIIIEGETEEVVNQEFYD